MSALDGPVEDRFLRRWSAVEAFVGDRRDELTERLSERITVLVEDEPSRRARVKESIKESYALRSQLSHGAQTMVARQHARALRRFSLRAIERTGLFVHLNDERAFIALIERAKFEGIPATVREGVEVGRTIRCVVTARSR